MAKVVNNKRLIPGPAFQCSPKRRFESLTKHYEIQYINLSIYYQPDNIINHFCAEITHQNLEGNVKKLTKKTLEICEEGHIVGLTLLLLLQTGNPRFSIIFLCYPERIVLKNLQMVRS